MGQVILKIILNYVVRLMCKTDRHMCGSKVKYSTCTCIILRLSYTYNMMCTIIANTPAVACSHVPEIDYDYN